jgi:Tfp pilus assembly protein PilN
MVWTWTTPLWIRALTAAAVLLALVLGTVISNVAATALDGVTAVGHQTAPQVATSADLAFALSDMDGQLANIILAGTDAGAIKQTVDRYEERRKQVDADLQLIAGVSGTDPSAPTKVPLLAGRRRLSSISTSRQPA